MKIIQCLADIEALRAIGKISIKLIKEVEKDLLDIFEAESNDEYLLEFRLPQWQALFVLEKGDDVLAKLDQPLELEYVERVEAAEVAYYRCAIRHEHEFQMFYSVIGTHDQEVEDWLLEQSQVGG